MEVDDYDVTDKEIITVHLNELLARFCSLTTSQSYEYSESLEKLRDDVAIAYRESRIYNDKYHIDCWNALIKESDEALRNRGC